MTVEELLSYLDPKVYVEVRYQDCNGATFTKYRGVARKLLNQEYLYWKVCVVTAEMNKIIVYAE